MKIEKFWAHYRYIQVTDWHSNQEVAAVYSSKEVLEESKRPYGSLRAAEVYGIRLDDGNIVVLGNAIKLVE